MSKIGWIRDNESKDFYDKRLSQNWMSSGEFYRFRRIYLRKEKIKRLYGLDK